MTGQATFSPELAAKRLEVVKAALPAVSRVALFWNAAAGRGAMLRHLEASQTAARALGLHVHQIEIPRGEDLDAGLQEARQAGATVIVTLQNAMFYALNRRVAELLSSINYRSCPPKPASPNKAV